MNIQKKKIQWFYEYKIKTKYFSQNLMQSNKSHIRFNA
jgi:hypothetical protein